MFDTPTTGSAFVVASTLRGKRQRPSPIDTHTLHIIDTAVLAVFVVESVVKITACGEAPYRYFADSWNLFDFAIVCISVLGMVPKAEDRMPGVAMLRLLRLLKLVNFYPSLNVAVSSLLKASSNVIYATIVMVLVVYVYAVVGMLLFRVNDPGHYGNLAQAIAAVWAVCTMDGWDVIMYVNMYGCSRFGYPFNEVECRNSRAFGWVAALYFVSLILFGAWMLPTVIIGITTIAFAESTEEIKEEYAQLKLGEEAAHKAADLFEVDVLDKNHLPQIHGLYRRLAECQAKGKKIEFKVDSTIQQECNAGLRDLTLRPFLKFVAAKYRHGLCPPNRHMRDKEANNIIASTCGDRHVNALCAWPVFLFLLNFARCSAKYEHDADAHPDEDSDDDDDVDLGKNKSKLKKKKGKHGHKKHKKVQRSLIGRIKDKYVGVAPSVHSKKPDDDQPLDELVHLAADGFVDAIDGVGDVVAGLQRGVSRGLGDVDDPAAGPEPVEGRPPKLPHTDDNYSCAGPFQPYLDGKKDTPLFCGADPNGLLDGTVFDLVVDRTPTKKGDEAKQAFFSPGAEI